jgi:hypothetical protein
MPKKPLEPKDFPVHDEGKTIVTDGKKAIAEANDTKTAEEICDRLNRTRPVERTIGGPDPE